MVKYYYGETVKWLYEDKIHGDMVKWRNSKMMKWKYDEMVM